MTEIKSEKTKQNPNRKWILMADQELPVSARSFRSGDQTFFFHYFSLNRLHFLLLLRLLLLLLHRPLSLPSIGTASRISAARNLVLLPPDTDAAVCAFIHFAFRM